MNNAKDNNAPAMKPATPSAAFEDYKLLYFSKLLNCRVRLDQTNKKNGRLTDLVFRLTEPYPEAVGIYIEHGKGYPSELIPWEKVARIAEEAIFINPKEGGGPYPPFVDQKGWILLNEHLMGQTILDMDGRRTEVVNDVHLLYSKGRMILVHVDISFNGFLRKWHLERFASGKDQLISWRYVQPLSVEDHTKDIVTLSVAREQALELPSEDLADALEVVLPITSSIRDIGAGFPCRGAICVTSSFSRWRLSYRLLAKPIEIGFSAGALGGGGVKSSASIRIFSFGR